MPDTMTVMPTPRWVSLTMTFPGVGSIARHLSIYTPVVCPRNIGERLIAKFYAKEIVEDAEADDIDRGIVTVPITIVPNSPLVEVPVTIAAPITLDGSDTESEQSIEAGLVRFLAAVNGAQTIDELKDLGIPSSKASVLLDATPVDTESLKQILSSKVLAILVAKFDG